MFKLVNWSVLGHLALAWTCSALLYGTVAGLLTHSSVHLLHWLGWFPAWQWVFIAWLAVSYCSISLSHWLLNFADITFEIDLPDW